MVRLGIRLGLIEHLYLSSKINLLLDNTQPKIYINFAIAKFVRLNFVKFFSLAQDLYPTPWGSRAFSFPFSPAVLFSPAARPSSLPFGFLLGRSDIAGHMS